MHSKPTNQTTQQTNKPNNAVQSFLHAIFRGFDSGLPDSKAIGQAQNEIPDILPADLKQGKRTLRV
jgi:hypothetical protein